MLDEVRMWPVTGAALAVLWLFVRDVPFTPGSIVGELLIGTGIGLGVAYLFRHMYVETINLRQIIMAAPYAAVYLYTFVIEMVKGNITVMSFVLSRRSPVRPDVVEIPLRVRSDAAVTLIANSITLTPRTLTMDYDPGTNVLYVHAIAGEDRDAVIEPIRRWEDLVLHIFEQDPEAAVATQQVPAAEPVKPEVGH